MLSASLSSTPENSAIFELRHELDRHSDLPAHPLQRVPDNFKARSYSDGYLNQLFDYEGLFMVENMSSKPAAHQESTGIHEPRRMADRDGRPSPRTHHDVLERISQ